MSFVVMQCKSSSKTLASTTVNFISLRTCVPACDRGVVTPRRPPALFEQEQRKLVNMALSKTSAEPARTAAYSSDIGWRVV